jgi:hypothetical protein
MPQCYLHKDHDSKDKIQNIHEDKKGHEDIKTNEHGKRRERKDK